MAEGKFRNRNQKFSVNTIYLISMGHLFFLLGEIGALNDCPLEMADNPRAVACFYKN